MRITAVGDCAIQKNLPRYYDGFDKVREYINRGDIRFFNLETTVCENCYPARHSGGTWLRTDKSVLNDMLEFGFNAVTAANNHCMDYSMNGFLQTIDSIKAAGLKQSGCGRSLAEAAAPAYIDTPDGRAAVISCTANYSPGAEAGEQSRDFPGRPGINPISLKQTVYVDREDFDRLSQIAAKTGLNAHDNIIRREGYLPPESKDELNFGGSSFKIGEPGIRFDIAQTDLKRIETAIKDASFQADVVLISVHSHQTEGEDKETVPGFLKEFAHFCIDRGAHAVIGHGPHLLRRIEIYKGLPIFYSLGDFILQLENCAAMPNEYYQKYGLTPEAGLYEVFRTRTKDFTVGLQRQREMTETVIPCFDIVDGALKCLELMAVELGFGMPHSRFGWPRYAPDSGILERLAAMSGLEIDKSGKVFI
ncbi:MAG: CapA family protein [Clostridia bacterium]|nr:CapA family protein [Clostridia bacterium]